MNRGQIMRLAQLEARENPTEQTRRSFRFIIESDDNAAAAERCRQEHPDALVISRIIVWPPQRDTDENIIAPARDYRGPLIERTAA
jgi:hypothetical protein